MRIGHTLALSRRLASGPRLILENGAVDELVVVTGPPGAGKSSVSEELAKRWKPSALVPGDVFFGMIKQGYILPWLPQARGQNTVIIEAAAAAAGRLCHHCVVVYDGVVGPWFLPTFLRASGLAHCSMSSCCRRSMFASSESTLGLIMASPTCQSLATCTGSSPQPRSIPDT
jgi:hypothetical protein